jgi:endoglucanase
MRRRSLRALLLLAALGACSSSYSGDGVGPNFTCPPPGDSGGLLLRYNQVGYRPSDPKRLWLMAPAAIEPGASFIVYDDACHVVLSAGIGADQGSWSSDFAHVYLLDASSITVPGRYRITATSGNAKVSAEFSVDPGQSLYGSLLSHALFFYKAQRDGPKVDSSVLGRKPSHLADETASVYATPVYANDTLKKGLTRVSGPVDVSGGWFDAGDYLKFVETASYVDLVMLLAVRDQPDTMGPSGPADFFDEARFGLDWLLKMYDDETQTLYYQVGIGDGNASILGDHDFWRLPEADDLLKVSPGDAAYFVHYRPAFVVGPAGSKISPNLAGRLAADFALGSVVYRSADEPFANRCLLAAEHVYHLADTSLVGNPFTTAPYDYYPETAWQDDLELGSTELYQALASVASLPSGLPETDPNFYLGEAAKWAQAYITSSNDGADSLNLYDVSALAHYELWTAMSRAGSPTHLAVQKAALLEDLKAQVETGSEAAKHDPFELGLQYATVDAVPHALGLALSADFYEELSGDTRYHSFGLAQRDWVFGANAWGSSFIVGAGMTFPDCMQHQIANLVGSLDGSSPLLLGAAVDGPSDPSNFEGLSLQDGMRRCPARGGDAFKAYNGHGAAYQDNVVDWPSVEPADDYTVLSILLFARQ